MRAEVTHARESETKRLERRLVAGWLYVVDRGFADYGFFQAIIDAGSSFVGRVQQNAVYEIVNERRVTDEAKAAGVEFDRVVRLGGPGALARPTEVRRLAAPGRSRARSFRSRFAS